MSIILKAKKKLIQRHLMPDSIKLFKAKKAQNEQLVALMNNVEQIKKTNDQDSYIARFVSPIVVKQAGNW